MSPREINYRLGDYGEKPLEVVSWIKKEVEEMKRKSLQQMNDGTHWDFPLSETDKSYNKALEDVITYLDKLLK